MARKLVLKGALRQIIARFSFYSGYCFIAHHLRISNGGRILCYHGITPHPFNQYAISTITFMQQMEYLVNNYLIISIDHLVEMLRNGERISPKVVAVTIDDGFLDVYENAYPIFIRYNIPATIFLPVKFINNNSLQEENHLLPQNKFLTWDQIREMSNNGCSFGSHTVSHISLGKLSNSQIQYELETSKTRIEMELGKNVTGFAYPYGTYRDFNPKIERLVEEAGYSWAVSTLSGVNKVGRNLYALRRTTIENSDSYSSFQHVMSGALDPWIIMQKLGFYIRHRKKVQ